MSHSHIPPTVKFIENAFNNLTWQKHHNQHEKSKETWHSYYICIYMIIGLEETKFSVPTGEYMKELEKYVFIRK